MRPASSGRWLIVGLLFTATLISYVDRHSLSVVAPLVREDLGLSNLEYANIVTAFLIAYTIMQPVTGWLIDRLGTRTGFSLIMLWWSVAAIAHALGRGVASFGFFRFLLGSGQAGSWSASVRAVSECFPAGQRGLANGCWGAGTSLGLVLAVPLAAWLSSLFGWRWMFVITGSSGLIWLLFWIPLYRTPPKESPDEATADVGSPVFLTLLSNRSVWAVVLSRMLADPTAWFYHYWLPSYLSDARGFNLTEVGLLGWIPFMTQSLGILSGGALSDYIHRRGLALINSRLLVMGVGAFFMLSALSAAFPTPIWVTLIGISLATFGFGLWAPNMMSICGEAFPKECIGTVTGLSGFGAGVGATLFTLLTGWLVDNLGYNPVFGAAALMPVGAFLLLYSLLERRVRIS